MKVRLIKLDSVENPYIEPCMQYVQKDEIRELFVNNLPKEGEPLFGLNKHKGFKTSIVEKIIDWDKNYVIFETMNSRYKIEFNYE